MSTEIEKDAAAIVWHPDTGYSLMLPDGMKDDDEVPPEHVILTAIIMRLVNNDDGFTQEQLDWFKERT